MKQNVHQSICKKDALKFFVLFTLMLSVKLYEKKNLKKNKTSFMRIT